MSGTPFTVALEPITLECGVRLPSLRLAGWRWGRSDRPVVLLVHALTGDARADRWWPALVGPGKVLDPEQVQLLCFNNLGSAYGSTSPLDDDFPTRAQVPGPRQPAEGKGPVGWPEDRMPAPLTPWDQARALLLALDALAVDRVGLLVGGSLGGMIALCLAALDPQRFGRVMPLATDVRATPWVIGWNHVGRQAIVEDLAAGGDGRRGLALARQLAHLSYRANPGLEVRQGRRTAVGPAFTPSAPYRMQTYLQHQGQALARRFDPRCYLTQLDAMDHHDLARRPPRDPHERWAVEGPWGEARLRDLLVVGIDTDQLFPPGPLEALALRVPGAVYRTLRSPHGHDGFLLPSSHLSGLVARALPEEVPCRTAC